MIALLNELEARGYKVELWQLPGSEKGVLQVTLTEPGPAEGATTYVGVDWPLFKALLHINKKRYDFYQAEQLTKANQ